MGYVRGEGRKHAKHEQAMKWKKKKNVQNYFSLFISGIPVNTLRGSRVSRRTREHRSTRTIAFLTEQKLSLAGPSGGTRNVCKYTRSDKRKDATKGKKKNLLVI